LLKWGILKDILFITAALTLKCQHFVMKFVGRTVVLSRELYWICRFI